MRSSALGYWIESQPQETATAPLSGDVNADVVIVGGGYLGLWTAVELAQRARDLRVVLLERARCGYGASGRNGGFANHDWDRLASVTELLGSAAAVELATASSEALQELGAWCSRHGSEAEFRWTPQLEISTGPSQDGAWEAGINASQDAGRGDDYEPLSPERVQQICRSPVFRGGALTREAATINPAGLVRALRRRAESLDVAIFEGTPALHIADSASEVAVVTPGGRVRARHGVLAVNWRTAAIQPLRRRLSVASSHVVATHPVRDVLEACGWTPAYSLCDVRALLHYFRLTGDSRIVFGWGGGKMALDGREPRELFVDPQVHAQTAGALMRFFPGLSPADINVAWGGPIDVSADHLPHFGSLRSLVYGFGFTGNGVVPAHMGGKILSELILDSRGRMTRLPIVEDGTRRQRFPPALSSYVGGTVLRRLMVTADARDEQARAVGPLLGAAIRVPRKLGFHLPR